MSYYCYFENEFHPLDTPLLKTNDLGLLRGYGLFDYFRTYNGIPFRLEDYWQRFVSSANSLHLSIPLNLEDVREILSELYRRSGQAEVAYRMLLTGGYASDGLNSAEPNLIIRAEPLPADNPAGRQTGIRVLPYEYIRDMPYVKSTGYLHAMVMAGEVKRQGASDLLFHKDGKVSELTRSNLFIVKGEIISTPDKDALRGITRKLVIEKASSRFDVQERAVTLAELLEADEVFTTSTTKGAMPIVSVGNNVIGQGTPGPVSRLVQTMLEEDFRNYGK